MRNKHHRGTSAGSITIIALNVCVDWGLSRLGALTERSRTALRSHGGVQIVERLLLGRIAFTFRETTRDIEHFGKTSFGHTHIFGVVIPVSCCESPNKLNARNVVTFVTAAFGRIYSPVTCVYFACTLLLGSFVK